MELAVLALTFRGVALIVLGAILGVLLIMLFRKKRPASSTAAAPPPDLADLTIRDARPGDQVSIVGAGEDLEDLEFTVDRRNRYESGGEVWYEVSGTYRGRRVFVEWYEDDELEVSAALDGRSLTIQELGLREEDLIRFDEEQSRANAFQYDGATWRYSESSEIGYFRDDRGEGEGYYSWDFESEDGKRLLYIEKWEGEPFEAGIAVKLHPDDVRVFRK